MEKIIVYLDHFCPTERSRKWINVSGVHRGLDFLFLSISNLFFLFFSCKEKKNEGPINSNSYDSFMIEAYVKDEKEET